MSKRTERSLGGVVRGPWRLVFIARLNKSLHSCLLFKRGVEKPTSQVHLATRHRLAGLFLQKATHAGHSALAYSRQETKQRPCNHIVSLGAPPLKLETQHVRCLELGLRKKLQRTRPDADFKLDFDATSTKLGWRKMRYRNAAHALG